MKHTLLLLLSGALLLSCKNTESDSYHEESDEIYQTVESDPTYHENSNYKYEHRTGESGEYSYNYDVIGADSDGNEVSGNIDISGKYGSGIIQDADGNEREVDAEWVDYGQMEATDEDGNVYELRAE